MRLLAALAISLCLCFSVAGCNDSSADASGPEEATTSVEQGVMPYSSEEYCTMDWTLESIEDHFRELGFDSFEENPVEPEDDDYDRNIYELYVKSFIFTDPWEAGDQLDTDDTIVIYYNEQPTLTVESCPDLGRMVECADDYLTFAEEYDGKYVAFDAYVSYQLTSFTNDNIIMVSGENYDENQSHDWTIYIGNRTWDNTVQGGTPVGTRVHVEGRVDLDYSKYYDQLYLEGMTLYPIQ